MNADASKCPEHVRHSLQLYVDHGCRPGHFMTAVLSGDLFGAVNRADGDSLEALPHIVAYIYQNIRSDCYGTKAKVEAWKGAIAEVISDEA